ncbi:MAG: hypothetical protein HWD59_03655 [Coxiellaceae bacterium]|nr:MAG: hypothetical protein HWD59_03655 [Coxiellaceae bacterium]
MSKPAHFINLISAMEVFAVMPLPVDVNLNGNNIGNMLDFSAKQLLPIV